MDSLCSSPTGSEIEQDANHLHFICGCSNFEPAHNARIRELLKQILQEKDNAYFARSIPVAELAPQLVRLARQAAQEEFGPNARFRVWYTGDKGSQPSDNTWKTLKYTEITDEDGLLKKRLSSPIRSAFGEVLLQRLERTGPAPVPVQPTSQGEPAALVPHSPATIKQKIQALKEEFERQYHDRGTKMALGRLEEAQSGQDAESWSNDFYRYPLNTDHALQVDDDRRAVLKTLYNTVNQFDEWNQEQPSGYVSFEEAAPRIFKTAYVARILTVTLPMDRAQAFHRLRVDGLPWWSELHLEPDTLYARNHADEQQEWSEYIQGFLASADDAPEPPMNKRLFRLLFCESLGLWRNRKLEQWSRPAKVPTEEEEAEGEPIPQQPEAGSESLPTEITARRHSPSDDNNSLVDEDFHGATPAEKRPRHDGSFSLGTRSSWRSLLSLSSSVSHIDHDVREFMTDQAVNGVI